MLTHSAKIDVTKIDKSAIFVGQKGKYVDIAFHAKPDQYGNDGYITQDIGKQRRDSGERGPIIGSFRIIKRAPQEAHKQLPAPPKDYEPDDIPF